MPTEISISEAEAKYLLAILLDRNQLHTDGQMAGYMRGRLGRQLFGADAVYVSVEDAGPLVFEAMRETVWAS